jgi:hypothetical protein
MLVGHALEGLAEHDEAAAPDRARRGAGSRASLAPAAAPFAAEDHQVEVCAGLT